MIWYQQPRWWGRILLLLVVAIGYGLTIAPTVSFWDCGEFIAAAHVVGIPHPPGTPFFVILGRVWDLLFTWAGPVAFRINLLSAVSSALGALIAGEIASEILRHFRISVLLRTALAFFAGSMVAFSDTYWFNAVEAEVYGVSMFMLLLSVWAILRWDRATFSDRPKWLALFVYVCFLGMGVHTNSLLAFPLGWLFVGVRSGYLQPRRWVYGFVASIVIILGLLLWNPIWYTSSVFLGFAASVIAIMLGKAIYSKEWSRIPFWLLGAFLFSAVFLTGPFLIGLGGLLLVFAGILAIPRLRNSCDSIIGLSARLSFFLVLLAGIGYSTHLVLPIRSSTEPVMDENDPETWGEVRDALERKQYGSMGMLQRALWRRAEWTSQVGFSHRIGYLGYHLNQFSPAPQGAQEPLSFDQDVLQVLHRLFWEAVFVLVLLSIAAMLRRPQVAFIAGLFILTSAGLIFYVNFADGTRPDSRDAHRWSMQMQELKSSLSDPNLPALPNMLVIASAIETYRETGSVTPVVKNLMAWERAASKLGQHLPLPPRNVHREVRERDYFYTPAFVFFAILMALALASLVEVFPALWVGRIVFAGAMSLWLVPFLTHFEMHNRSQDWAARSFAWNTLQSVPPHGILITYGDNDTFPLWYLQMVEEVRQDVLVINSSLVQMDWYQEQMLRQRPDLQVESSLEDRQQRAYQKQSSPQFVLNGEPVYFAGDSTWRPGPGDQFIADIVEHNFPRISICLTYNASPNEIPGGAELGPQIAPITGLVRQLGLNQQLADSMLVERMAKEYLMDGFLTSHWRYQESTSRTAAGYRYLFRAAEQLAQLPQQRYAISQRSALFQ